MGVLGLETGTPRGLCGQADSRDGRLTAVGHLENQRRPGCGPARSPRGPPPEPGLPPALEWPASFLL